ncbi:MAG: cytochrome o ubiquinol oxidase subunit I, partial [Chlamydiae bacterium]|nr:cytochrome o ubiquinol oxidase subunit I [Chlamydiota bacterium]
MFGRLTLEAFKHDWIENGANFSMIFGAILLAVFITYKKKWMWIWKEWVTSVDHKKVGVMYIAVSSVMLFKGVVDAVMMRAQQAMACGEVTGYLTPDHYQQIFTAHGVTMIFFVGMGFVFGLINLVLPLQIGARDVAFPYLNSLS